MPEPSIIMLCMHKGASSFVADHLANELLEALPSFELRTVANERLEGDWRPIAPFGELAVRVYPRGRFVEKEPQTAYREMRLVALLRDPRDAAVSWFHSLAQSHQMGEGDPHDIARCRAILASMSVADGLLQPLRPERADGQVGGVSAAAVSEAKQLMEIVDHHPDPLLLRYEDLIDSWPAWIGALGAYLGLEPAAVQSIRDALADELRPPDVEDPSLHKRRMRPGNWREVFEQRHEDFFRRHATDVLHRGGYTW